MVRFLFKPEGIVKYRQWIVNGSSEFHPGCTTQKNARRAEVEVKQAKNVLIFYAVEQVTFVSLWTPSGKFVLVERSS